MKRVHYLSITIVVLAIAALLYSFKTPSPQPTATRWLQITVVESVIPGGIGRSRLVTVDDQGNMSEVKIKNFFSLAGINFGNIRENDLSITTAIQELSVQGWELKHVTSGAFSGNESNTNGIFLSRYLFSKAE
jgi:hypothetical protein